MKFHHPLSPPLAAPLARGLVLLLVLPVQFTMYKLGQPIMGQLVVSCLLSYSEEIFLHLVVAHTIQMVVNPTLLSLNCAIKR